MCVYINYNSYTIMFIHIYINLVTQVFWIKELKSIVSYIYIYTFKYMYICIYICIHIYI